MVRLLIIGWLSIFWVMVSCHLIFEFTVDFNGYLLDLPEQKIRNI